MENYISLNGQKIELTDEQVEKIKVSLQTAKKRLCDIAVGETFKIANHEFIVLEQSGDTTAAIRKELLFDEKRFGKNNNFNGSDVDVVCGKFAADISAVVDADNLVLHTVDLIADDGLKDYGKIMRRMSLMTADLYRRYVDVLDLHKVEKWWWLATPLSTEKHRNSSSVKCVSPSGCLYFHCYCNDGGVRPFCILKSHIFVSK